ncbi:hypothetical protein ACKVMT_17820 [Halobacteriales archaeon Cl-PHB]
MAHETSSPRDGRIGSSLAGLPESDWFWLGLGLAAGLFVYGVYLLTHQYPAYAGGMYLEMGQQLVDHGYGLPETVPLYGNGGVPFAYPPLGFYVTAVLLDLGVSPMAISLYLPGLLVVAYLVPFFAIARDLLGSPRQASLATVLFAVTPTVLRWHLSAGGFVRALALGLALTGIYASIRLFRTGDRRWLVAATGLFGLTILTHPVYTVFFGLSCLLAYLAFDRTLRGLLAGAVVAAGGLVLAAPWWIQVAATHGVDIFLTASGTHSGLLGGPERLADQFLQPVFERKGRLFLELNPEVGMYLLAYAGAAYAVVKKRYFLLAWLVVATYVIGKNRFLFVAGSMLAAVFVAEAVAPAVGRRVHDSSLRRRVRDTSLRDAANRLGSGVVPLAVVALVVVATGGAGALYAGGALNTAHQHSPTQPQFMDDADEAAMGWAGNHTDPSADFAVASDAAEWFPVFANRSIVLGPWGYEWKDTDGYYQEVELFKNVSACRNASCYTERIAGADRHPDYLYVPKGHYTVRGQEKSMPVAAVDRLTNSNRYRLVYENEGAAIFRVTAWPVAAGNATGWRPMPR